MKSAVYMLMLISVAVYADWGSKGIFSKKLCEGNICKSYKVINAEKAYADAERYCQSSCTKGHLVSIHTEAENELVLQLVKSSHGNNVSYAWIGAVRLMESKYFIWTDGSTWGYKNWKSGQPDDNNTQGKEACVEMYTANDHPGKWNDDFCEHKRAFICQHF